MWRLVIRSILLAVLVQATTGATQESDIHTSADPQQRLTITRNLTSMPLAFTENRGQWDEQVKFRANAGGATMWFTETGAYYQFTRRIPMGGVDVTLSPSKGGLPLAAGAEHFRDGLDRQPDSIETMMIKASFVGANLNPAVRGEEMMEYKCNYFIGNDPSAWHTDVPNYRTIVLEEVYAGIDLKYYGNGRQMEYDFIVSPGADYARIQIEYEGAKFLSVNNAGELVVETEWGTVTELRPLVYQVKDGERQTLAGEYSLLSDNSFGFALPSGYNPELILVIDPVLSYSTYLGGSDFDASREIAADESGAVYVTGYTYSIDFPTLNPYQGRYQGDQDVFVTKLSSSGSSLVYSTYLGGVQEDMGLGIAVDASGAVYVSGVTLSVNFPTSDPYQGTYQGGDSDAFVAKLSSSGNTLVYSTYLGGSRTDLSSDIAVDASGAAYVTGNTNYSDFPTLNPYQTHQALADVFVTKLNSSGNGLVYSTYLGGSYWDYGGGIVVDASGSAYVTGNTQSTDFPTLTPYQTNLGGDRDVFVAKLSSSGSSLIYSTYLGGSDGDFGRRIVVDVSGAAYVAGSTRSTDFPILNPIQGTFQGGTWDAFVAKLSSSGNSLTYSTYLGGSDDDHGRGIAVDASGAAWVAGETSSTDFPTVDPYQGTHQGGFWDAFVAKLSSSGNSVDYSTYLGGSSFDFGRDIAVDVSGTAYVTGETSSTDFPTLNPYETVPEGRDVFVTKFYPFSSDLDSDEDGIPDWTDNCRFVPNASQDDSDEDGIGDVCDACQYDPDNDIDGDGHCVPADNCPLTHNPGQEDTDLDGIGDVCDNCPAVSNTDQADTDLDSVGDLCDPITIGFDADVLRGSPPLTVTFADNSTGLNPITEWLWDFGDNQTGPDQNPVHEYLEAGVYDVTLIASDGVSTDTLQQLAMIMVSSALLFDIVEFSSGDVWQIKVADLDHDNETDLVWTSASTSTLGVAYGDGQGSFSLPVWYSTAASDFGAIGFGFLNSDGLIDVLVRGKQAGLLDVFLNNGDRSFSVSSYSLPSTTQMPSAVATGYFDSDQFLDVVTDAGSYVGDGTGNLTPGLWSVPPFGGVDVGDFNGDGFDDLVTAEIREVAIYTNDGDGNFTKTGSVSTTDQTYEVSAARGVADFDHDGDVDYAAASYSTVTVILGDGAGGVDDTYTLGVDGLSHNLVVVDANRDHELDIVLSNIQVTENRVEFYFGLGDGTFDAPVYVPWGTTYPYRAYALAGGDFDRDGNPDFVTGDVVLPGAPVTPPDPLLVAYSLLPDAPVLESGYEMRTIGYNNVSVHVSNPDGYVISRPFSTVAGSNYFRFDADSSGTIDQETIDYNLQLGDYQIVGTPPPDAGPTGIIFMGIGIDGSQKRTIAHNYSLNIDLKAAQPDAAGSFVFPFTMEEISSIYPENGLPTANQQPTFDWSGLVQDDGPYHFQLDKYHDFSSDLLIYDVTGLNAPQFTPDAPLAPDSVYYWRFLTSGGVPPYSDTSYPFAAYIVSSCCTGRVGDANGVGGDEPTIGDVSTMIDALFIGGDPAVIACLAEADVNQSGGIDPQPGDITIGDISYLIDYLFITGPTLGLPDCL